MKEIVFDYKEFTQKIDTTQPIHHSCEGENADRHGIMYRLTFRIFAVAKKGHIVIFEATLNIDTLSNSFTEQYLEKHRVNRGKGIREHYLKLVEKFAKPLGSTEGRVEGDD